MTNRMNNLFGSGSSGHASLNYPDLVSVFGGIGKMVPISLILIQRSRQGARCKNTSLPFVHLNLFSGSPGGAIVRRRFEEGDAVSLLQRVAVPRQSELVEDGAVVVAPRPVQDVGGLEDLRPRQCCHGQLLHCPDGQKKNHSGPLSL